MERERENKNKGPKNDQKYSSFFSFEVNSLTLLLTTNFWGQHDPLFPDKFHKH